MKAVTVVKNGVEISDVAKPTPKKNEVLIKVIACGLNRADLSVADGGAHGNAGGPGTIVGMEFSGEVVELGEDVNSLSIGDRVMCSGSSAWAEYAITDYGRVIKIPDNNMDFITASTLPIALATMHNAIVTAGGFIEGQSILIQGASSGVGLMGLQIAKSLKAKMIFGTSTKPDKFHKLEQLGADFVINSKDSNEVAAGNAVGIFFPNQENRGTHINVSGIGVAKSSKNKENAIKFIEFLISKDIQEIFAKANYEYPVNKDAKSSELLKSWGEFKEDKLSLTKLGELNKKAVILFDEVKWP